MKKIFITMIMLLATQILVFGQSLNTELVGRYESQGYANKVVVDGNYVYIAAGSSGLRIINASSPSSPEEVGYYNSGRVAYDVIVKNNKAFIAYESNGLKVVDVSTPSAPDSIGGYDTGGIANAVAVNGNYAYIADGVPGLRIIDISNPTLPNEVSLFATEYAGGVYVNNNYAYIADYGYGLRIIDVSNPASPSEIGSLETGGLSNNVVVSGNYAYLTDDSGLRIIDISTPASPREIGQFSKNSNTAYDVKLRGKYAFVALGSEGLYILDISSPTTPTEVGYYKFGGNAKGVALTDDYIFLVGFYEGLYILSSSYLLPDSSQSSTINGKVTNALDGTPIAGALVEIAGLSTTTDNNGNYEITDIPEAVLKAEFSCTPLSGNAPLEVSFTDKSTDAAHTLIVSATDYSTYTNNQVVIAAGETLTMDVSLSPTLTEGEMRIVLNWGNAPDDLDSYLKTPNIDGSEYTIYFSEKGNATSAPFVTLDHDDRDAYGPETITIYKRSAGTYKYYVHNYSGSPDMTTSNAVVQVYTNNGLITSVNIPTSGSGIYWNVLTIDGTTGAISVINQIIESSPGTVPTSMTEKPTLLSKTTNSLQSSQAITSWNWDFGDGTTSIEQNPIHTYMAAGTYTVSLRVSNGTTNSTEIKTNFITVNSSANGVILAENFDGSQFPPDGWTVKITNSGNTWQQANPENNNFSTIDETSVFSAVCTWVAEDQDEWLKSPIVSLPNDEIRLQFYAGFSTAFLNKATLKLHISTDGGTSWTKIWEANNDGEAWGWREISLDISSYKNSSNVMFGWQYVGNDGDLVGIDNVKLEYGIVGVNNSAKTETPNEYDLEQNYPNPFNPTTVISYSLPKQGMVSLNIYNILGEKVVELVNKTQNAGNYSVNFNAKNLPSGIYIYKIQVDGFAESKKMLLLK